MPRAITGSASSGRPPVANEAPIATSTSPLTRSDDGRIGVVGKAHHCMVDGIAAVELAQVLLDPEPDSPPEPRDEWEPAASPGPARRLVDGVVDRTRDQLALAGSAARLVLSPSEVASGVNRASRALLSSLAPATPLDALNGQISPYRALATLGRPLDELRAIKRACRSS